MNERERERDTPLRTKREGSGPHWDLSCLNDISKGILLSHIHYCRCSKIYAHRLSHMIFFGVHIELSTKLNRLTTCLFGVEYDFH